MAIRLSGMNSGLDTDAIVKALVSGYTTKKEKYEKAQTKLGWKQESWKSLNTKVYSMYSNISNLRFQVPTTLKRHRFQTRQRPQLQHHQQLQMARSRLK